MFVRIHMRAIKNVGSTHMGRPQCWCFPSNALLTGPLRQITNEQSFKRFGCTFKGVYMYIFTCRNRTIKQHKIQTNVVENFYMNHQSLTDSHIKNKESEHGYRVNSNNIQKGCVFCLLTSSCRSSSRRSALHTVGFQYEICYCNAFFITGIK